MKKKHKSSFFNVFILVISIAPTSFIHCMDKRDKERAKTLFLSLKRKNFQRTPLTDEMILNKTAELEELVKKINNALINFQQSEIVTDHEFDNLPILYSIYENSLVSIDPIALQTHQPGNLHIKPNLNSNENPIIIDGQYIGIPGAVFSSDGNYIIAHALDEENDSYIHIFKKNENGNWKRHLILEDIPFQIQNLVKISNDNQYLYYVNYNTRNIEKINIGKDFKDTINNLPTNQFNLLAHLYQQDEQEKPLILNDTQFKTYKELPRELRDILDYYVIVKANI